MIAKHTPLIYLFYDPAMKQISGKNGKFVSYEEFLKDPPIRQEDIYPTDRSHAIKDPPEVAGDPGPTPKCINHRVYICDGTLCYLKQPLTTC
jgi:hypothetical protein